MSGSVASSMAPGTPEIHGEQQTPLFKLLVERMQAGGRWEILDLGRAQATTIEICGRLRCRLDIVDLPAWVGALNAAQSRPDLDNLIESILPAKHNGKLDVVLCRDLLNRLERPALIALMDHITVRLRPGATMHALIEYSNNRAWEIPGRNIGSAGARTRNAPAARSRRETACLTPKELSRYLPDYQIDRALLLGSGMQEYLFCYRSAGRGLNP